METEGNCTQLTSFVLVGFTTDPILRITFFLLFLISYTLTLTGNLGLITLIYLDSCLHTPMYFFVANLSFLDVWYTSVYTPRILSDCISENKVMSLAGCTAQFFFSAGLAYSECFLLAIMAYDRYVAICNPLLYATAMSKKLCIQMVIGSYIGGFAHAIVHTGNTFRLCFCGNNVINHYFCDAPPLMNMACEDTQVYTLNPGHCRWLQCVSNHWSHTGLLHGHCGSHFTHPLSCWTIQGLLHLFSPPCLCFPLLWLHTLNVFPTQLPTHPELGQGKCLVLHCHQSSS